MKVYMSGYRNHWVSPYTIIKRVCFWRVLTTKNDDEDAWYDEPWAEKWADRLQPWCERLREFLDWIHPPIRYVKIDHYDTWSMDHTLAHIIHPMLIQLRDTAMGSGQTDPEDVPEHLRPTDPPGPHNNYEDSTVHERWQWVMNEMIWAFEQELQDDDTSKFYDHSGVDHSAGLNTQIGQIKVDRAGLEAHEKRKANGFRLFGKYYQSLWD